jgi:hypothetical protein
MDPTELANMLGGSPPANDESPDYASLLGLGSAAPAGGPGGPVTSPSDPREDSGGPANVPSTPALANPFGMLPTKSVEHGGSVSASGYSPAANAAIVRGPKTALEKAEAGDRAEIKQEYAPDLATLQKSADEEKAALEQQALITKHRGLALSQANMDIADANYKFQAREQAAMENAKVESDHSMAQYKAAQADFAASHVDPNQLWNAAGAGGQANMMMVAFAHDFLGAKGIQTSGLDTLRQGIQNNINAQLENIHHKRDVAAGFKEIWEMQRAQSATDAEARQRMNGFYLQSLSHQMDATLGGYDSELAAAKLAQAKAAIGSEMVKNDLAVRQHVETAANARASNRVHAYAAELTASTAKAEMASREKIAQITADAKGAKNAPRYIFDPETNKGKWVLHPGLSDKEKENASERVANLEVFNNALNELRTFDRTHKPMLDPLTGKLSRFNDEDTRRAEGLRKQLAHTLVHANGERATDQDIEDFEKSFPQNTFLTNGGVSKILAYTQKRNIEATRATVRQYGVDVPEKEQPNGPDVSGLMGGDYTDASITAAGQDKHVNTDSENLISQAKTPHALEEGADKIQPGTTSVPGTEADYKAFKASNLGSGAPSTHYSGSPMDVDSIVSAKNSAERAGGEVPSKAFAAIDALADRAAGGDADALAQLHELAQPHYASGGTRPAGDNALNAMAMWELQQRLSGGQ